ncbi:hypothetical protein HNQ34_000738 [Anoxybacillus tepidamans]|uniref:Swarming motility protein SwrB n=1 Tax=Anoxybacteroides tepidamans TaxID=265948 RepID=A0A7W8IN64_9BACL|nr:hypothetical protein [Anoxybacillus tepidamans]MBB5323646.1 hypothetical protein [Anoxybacillus tepidamans]
MTAFLFIISFALHALSLFIIILLYLQLSRIKEVEKRQSQFIKEMEQTVSAYLVEWKEENERFLNVLSKKMNRRNDDGEAKRPSEMRPQKGEWTLSLDHVEKMKDKVEISTVYAKKNEQPSASSLVEQVLQLQKEGKTIEEIAKLLKKGKTEIELLLKFRQM